LGLLSCADDFLRFRANSIVYLFALIRVLSKCVRRHEPGDAILRERRLQHLDFEVIFNYKTNQLGIVKDCARE